MTVAETMWSTAPDKEGGQEGVGGATMLARPGIPNMPCAPPRPGADELVWPRSEWKGDEKGTGAGAANNGRGQRAHTHTQAGGGWESWFAMNAGAANEARAQGALTHGAIVTTTAAAARCSIAAGTRVQSRSIHCRRPQSVATHPARPVAVPLGVQRTPNLAKHVSPPCLRTLDDEDSSRRSGHEYSRASEGPTRLCRSDGRVERDRGRRVRHVSNWTDRCSVDGQADEQTSRRPDEQTGRRPNNPPSSQPNNQPTSLPA
ncbi:hypothetical protein K505DRAFT_417740 [Melanomma pulvis-pyrius CBS 109.77]|uniref:Uncharacterized protein n=1 Tax=Melanomma pulvis-pyrius CBS 109.77 TaxID=1314802 RepID=A0A6A6XCT8_9PLEO|nr:hypothetical protein K505DRAFT_417740 [Melanomma pulvis-pyrius CBS 109.77]